MENLKITTFADIFLAEMYGSFIEALKFAAEKHVSQRRKGSDDVPYINHPIKVAELLYSIGQITDNDVLSAAVLHDTLEDTSTTRDELAQLFGAKVASIVAEVTDDMEQTYDDRKREQIRKAPTLSHEAKLIKIADKITNIRDILHLSLAWSNRRKRQYVEWSEKVVAGCRGVNPALDKAFDDQCHEAYTILGG